MTGGAGDDVAWGEGHRSGSEGCPPSPPFRTEAVFLDGGEPGQGGVFAGRFFRPGRLEKSREGGPQGVPQSSSRMRPLRRLAACRDNGASGEGVRALSAGAITWLKLLRPKHGVEQELTGVYLLLFTVIW